MQSFLMHLDSLLGSSYVVVHKVPGRIRLKAVNPGQGFHKNHLCQCLESVPAIESYRINPWATSVVIHYSSDFERILATTTQPEEAPQPLSSELGESKTALTLFSNLAQSSLILPLLTTGSAIIASHWLFLRPLARLTLILAGLPVAKRAFQSLVLDQKLNIDCLDLLALIFSSLQGKLVTPALVITLHEIGDLIREQTARMTEKKTASLIDTIGRWAWVERDGQMVQVPSDKVAIGETVIVYPGEQIPVDGVVISGEATVDQQQLTGESMPIVAIADTEVYAATLLRSGKLKILCQRVGKQTRAAASIELLTKAPVHDTRMANYAAQLADKLIVPSLVLAGVIYATTQDPVRTASILTLDFVTGIRVSMPTAFLSALNHTTRHGILVRSGRTLELLAEIDTIIFDKTGTLTCGDVAVSAVEVMVPDYSEQRLLQLAASAEQRLTHPVAEAIVHYAQQSNIDLLPRQTWEFKVGGGIDAWIEDHHILVGSEAFLRGQGVPWPDVCPRPVDQSVVYVAQDEVLLGSIAYSDPLRSDSVYLVDVLQKKFGMAVHLLTGDNHQRAEQVAQELNIAPAHVHAEAFPEDKAKIVQQVRRSGHVVAFVGDGLNDSVALAYADVSISFVDGSDVARETADVVLMNNELSSILEVVTIARQTRHLIEQNMLLVIAPNMLGLGLAATTGLNPLWATIIHNGTAIAAGLNSLRPLVQHQLETIG